MAFSGDFVFFFRFFLVRFVCGRHSGAEMTDILEKGNHLQIHHIT